MSEEQIKDKSKTKNKSKIKKESNLDKAFGKANVQHKDGSKEEIKDTIIESVYTKDKESVLLPLDVLYAAPAVWNVFDPWTAAEMEENKFSLLSNGLINPIIVKPFNPKESSLYDGDKTVPIENGYMILAGHNRVEAYKQLLEEAESDEDKKRFSFIPAIILDKDLANDKAVEIIVDTNMKCRKSISKKNEIAASKLTINTIKSQKNLANQTIAEVLKDKKLSRSKIYEDITIADKAINALKNYYYSGQINKKSILKLSQFDITAQAEIAKIIQDIATVESPNQDINYNIKFLSPEMNIAQIREILGGKSLVKNVIKYVTIPEYLVEDFNKTLQEWMKKHNL